jgi:hypothetical protein
LRPRSQAVTRQDRLVTMLFLHWFWSLFWQQSGPEVDARAYRQVPCQNFALKQVWYVPELGTAQCCNSTAAALVTSSQVRLLKGRSSGQWWLCNAMAKVADGSRSPAVGRSEDEWPPRGKVGCSAVEAALTVSAPSTLAAFAHEAVLRCDCNALATCCSASSVTS